MQELSLTLSLPQVNKFFCIFSFYRIWPYNCRFQIIAAFIYRVGQKNVTTFNHTQVFKMNIYSKFFYRFLTKVSNQNLITKSSHIVSCFLHSSIINNMFNPGSSSVDYSCNTHIEVCDDIAAHLKRDSSNFLTDVGLQGFNGLWVVVVYSLLQVPP